MKLRILDWFVSIYSKDHKDKYINKQQEYSELYFDPFCRKKKVMYKN